MVKSSQCNAWPLDAAQRIAAARQRGDSFKSIAATFGVSATAVRGVAIRTGAHNVTPRARFTAEEDRIIRADYRAHIDVAVTAAKLGRSRGAVRQRIFHYLKELLGRGRTPRSWRALRRYGSAMLSHGASPDEAAVKVQRLIADARTQARAAANAAKARRRNERIELMLEQIAAGRARDRAVFEARALGATFQEIGRAIGVTRERVRQICDRQAFEAATGMVMSPLKPQRARSTPSPSEAAHG